MPKPVIPLCDLHAEYLACKQPIDEAIARVIGKSAFILGKEVEQFEKAWAERCGADHCVAVSNCTDALSLSLKAAGSNAASRVLVPSMTVTADAEAVLMAGGTPIFGDVDGDGMLKLSEVVNHQMRSGLTAIIVVHLHGKPHPHIETIAELCTEKRLLLIEDCAHAHGADVGKHGDFSCWSFFPSKVLGCMGDAGAITFSGPPQITEQYAGVLKERRNHGRRVGEKYLHEEHGGNYRMDGLQAAILHAKLTSKWEVDYRSFFNECLMRRRTAARLYSEAFGLNHDSSSSYYVYAIQHERRDQLATFLRGRGIATGQHYPVPLHRQPVYEHYGYKCPGADEFARKTLSLPLSPFLSHEDQQRVIDAIKEFGL